MISERSTCRACYSNNLTPLFSLGSQYVNDFPLPADVYKAPRVPITLDLCNDCTMVQLRHTAPQELLYTRHYWYRSGVTDTMRAALRDITATIESLVDLRAGDIVLDIGSNDGTLLRSYSVPGLHTVGVEPATNLAEEGAKGVHTFISDFWPSAVYKCKPARAITAIGMFYDLEDPNPFIAAIAENLADDGLFVAQLMCLRNMVELGDVGNFAHEHLEFYSLRSLQFLFRKHGLEIIDVETNTVNGQSYRLYCRHRGVLSVAPKRGAHLRIEQALKAEAALDDPEFYRDFHLRLELNKDRVVRFVRRALTQGKRVWVYGASTKGNVILQYYHLNSSMIEGAAERSPEKCGRVTVGTGIPIYSEEEARKQKPDYFLVLPYAFINEFLEREKPWQIQHGGKFIVPLPRPYIIGYEGGLHPLLRKEYIL